MIAIIDYGLGNLRSVSKALESAGASVCVTNEREDIFKAKGIVLPGVGAFHCGMRNLKNMGLINVLNDVIREGKPFLGICLGLQLLFSETEEHGIHKGLDIIKGRVKRFTGSIKIPHMGWNEVKIKKGARNFGGIPDNSYFYFVHSYYVEPEDKDVVAATTEYGREFTSAIEKDNIFGVQFHPEKSGELGLKLLGNFVKHAG